MHKVIIDPPLGWRYGYPTALLEGETVEESLRRHGYPEKEIEFASKHYRSWHEETSEDPIS